MTAVRAAALPICAAILLATTSATAADVIPAALSLKKLISWGYGCGGHCAFNHRGDSTVTLAFGGKGDVTAIDKGSYTFGQSSPGGHREETREWDFTWRGTWTEDAGVRTLSLTLDASSCTSKGGTTRADRQCPAPKHKLTLACKSDRITLGEKRGTPDGGSSATEPALVCRPGESATYFGTTPPWTFGTEKPITTRYIGEPHPETFFSVEK